MDRDQLIQIVSKWPLYNGTGLLLAVFVYLILFGLILPVLRLYKDPLWPRGTLDGLYHILLLFNGGFGLFLNTLLLCSLVKEVVVLKYNWICQPISSKSDIKVAMVVRAFILAKLCEWMDTVLLIRQMGRLGNGWYMHVMHHAAMVILAWIALTTYPAGTTAICILLNCLTHLCDYGFQCARNFGIELDGDQSRVQINRIRRIQFLLVALICFAASIAGCGVPRFLLIITGAFSSFLLVVNIEYTGRIC